MVFIACVTSANPQIENPYYVQKLYIERDDLVVFEDLEGKEYLQVTYSGRVKLPDDTLIGEIHQHSASGVGGVLLDFVPNEAFLTKGLERFTRSCPTIEPHLEFERDLFLKFLDWKVEHDC